MSMRRALALSAAITALGAIGTASALANQHNDRGYERGGVTPCSLDGVNPAVHPEIFGNAATAASYGFVRVGGTWRVRPDCRR